MAFAGSHVVLGGSTCRANSPAALRRFLFVCGVQVLNDQAVRADLHSTYHGCAETPRVSSATGHGFAGAQRVPTHADHTLRAC